MGKIINIVVFVLMTGSFSLYAAGILKLTKTEKGEIQWGITPENAHRNHHFFLYIAHRRVL